MDPLGITGTVIDDKYAVDDAVGEGGFSTVYRAMHLLLKRPVALKVFHAAAHFSADERDRLVERFMREASLLADLSERTATICQARDVGTLDSPSGPLPYMVLEWLEGRTLESILEDEQRAQAPPRSLDAAMRWLEPIARALEIAHERGIAHRDVKPSNIFILSDKQTPKLLDFGIATIVQDHREPFARAGRRSAFTPAYGAPEQFSPEIGESGPWTDVFALALVLSEVVSGQPPLTGRSLGELGNAALNPQRRPTPRALGAQISNGAELAFRKALAIEPKDRFATAGEFWSALAQGAIDIDVEHDRKKLLQSAPPKGPPPSSSTKPPPRRDEDATMRRVEQALAALGLLATLTLAALTARESWGFGKHQLQRGYTSSLCVIDSVQGEEPDRILNLHTRNPPRIRGVAREGDASAPTPGFGGSEPEPPTYTRLVGAEVPCFYDPTKPDEMIVRRWTQFSVVPLALLTLGFLGALSITRWMFRRLRGSSREATGLGSTHRGKPRKTGPSVTHVGRRSRQ